jgi:Ca2+-transporting ATPase
VGSLLQGIVITAGCLGMAYWGMQQGFPEPTVRTLLFVTLLFSNIFLTLVNRSFEHTTLTTLLYRNYLMPLVILITLLGVAAMLSWPFLRNIFLLTPLTGQQILYALATAWVTTFWMDLYKVLRRSLRKKPETVENPNSQ